MIVIIASFIFGAIIAVIARNSAKPDSVKQAEWDARIKKRPKLTPEEQAELNARNQL